MVPTPQDFERAARKVWGEPNATLSKRDELRFGANGSKSVRLDKLTWFDHEAGQGGGYVELFKLAGEPLNGTAADIIATYDYRDEAGKLLFQVVRKVPKQFLQRRPSPSNPDVFIWNTNGVRHVLYRLPELLAADPAQPVFITEGEKDADNLAALGLVATTNPGGAGKWRRDFADYLRGRDVVILPDNDEAGEKHATDVRHKLTGIARSVRILHLPDLPPKGDVSDWFEAGRTAAELERLASETSERSVDLPELHKSSLTILRPADCETAEPSTYVVKGLLGRGNLALIIGQPGTGKSALGPHLGYAVAQGRRVFGRRVQQGPVMYFACEDGTGMQVRVRALRQQWGDAPLFMLVPDPVDLRSPGSTSLAEVERLVQAIKPVLIMIDTLARAFSGLKENDSDAPDGMGRVVQVARALAAICDSAVLICHHMPKDGNTPRGHGTLNGDADVTLIIEGSGDQPRIVRFGKNRNGPSGTALTFSIRAEYLGKDSDGDPITAAIAEEVGSTSSDMRAKEAKLRDAPALLLRELRTLVAEHSESVRPEPMMPLVAAVSRSELRQRLIARGWFLENLLRNAPSGKTELTRAGYRPENHALTTLKRKRFLSFTRDWVWLL